jgi:phosphomannomutase
MSAVCVDQLMERSGVAFGTSGARGLVCAMTDEVCYVYTRAFLQHLESRDLAQRRARELALAGDLRESTGRILGAVAAAARDAGFEPLHCGRIPSPAVALYGLLRGIPSVMVTGSHIPDDRNGIKFNGPAGEITKADEAGIRAQTVAVPGQRFDPGGSLRPPAAASLPAARRDALDGYVRRLLDFFPDRSLEGLRVGLYEHSSVAREALTELLAGLGAQVVPLGRSEAFVPVDTEAIRPEDVALARGWAAATRLDALVSADGDGDRPLIADERGRWLRGDVVGILCARYLGAEVVVTPVSSNTAVERCGWFAQVTRTRIGSPYVIEGMEEAVRAGARSVVGYEANGGFLVATSLEVSGRVLTPLPTRDAAVVILAVLALARRSGAPASALLGTLPPRFTASDRLKDFPTALSRARIAALRSRDPGAERHAIEAAFAGQFGAVAALDETDGLRITFASGEIVHLRPSGNAPELRCYNEADSEERALEMNRACLAILEGWRRTG